MYSVMMAAMLTAGTTAPQWGGHGSYASPGAVAVSWGGCYGMYGSGAFGCAGGMYACVGCYGGYSSWWSGTGSGPWTGGSVSAPAAFGAPLSYHAKATDEAAPAKVIVQLPAGARLFVEGKEIALDPETGSFTTPKLEAGAAFVYTLKAQAIRGGRVVSETKDIRVSAGGQTRVRFRELEAVAPGVARNSDEGPPRSSRITVQLPEKARLYVNGVLWPQRAFDTPPLDAGRDYSYTLKAELMRNGAPYVESKRVVFRAGEPVTVDFGEMTAKR
jgi:uncharacterized protein (TIGR03000 family)